MATRLGRYLRGLREAHGLTQDQACEASGVPQTTISGLETGAITRTSDANMAKLAAAYGVPRFALYVEAELIEAPELLLERPASPDDPLWLMVERVRRNPDLMRQLAALRDASADDVFEAVLEAVADAWRANLKMGITVAEGRAKARRP